MTELDKALEHLGNVLYTLADLDPGDRCDALDAALEFYNAMRPNCKVAPSGLPFQRLVHADDLLTRT